MLAAGCLAIVACAGGTAAVAEPAGSLASPMVDPAIFAEGQVRRLAGHFGQWTAVCDEVKGLRRRYCSLRSEVARDASGRGVYADVSTGDDGQPAALLHLPLNIGVRGVRIAIAEPETGTRTVKKPVVTLPVTLCSGAECLAVWTPRPADIAALGRRASLQVSFCSIGPRPLEFRPSFAASACEVWRTVAIPGAGFHESVLASVGVRN